MLKANLDDKDQICITQFIRGLHDDQIRKRARSKEFQSLTEIELWAKHFEAMSSPIDMPHQKKKTPLPQPIVATTIPVEKVLPKAETSPTNEELLQRIEDLQKQINDTK